MKPKPWHQNEEINLFRVMMTPHRQKLLNHLEAALYSGRVAEGPFVKKFEKCLIAYIGNQNLSVVNSCTTALKIAMRCCDVQSGDEVISTPLTCIPTNTSIMELGAKIVWCDVDPKTGLATADTVKAKITDKTKAIMLVHKEGDIVDLDPIMALGIPIIEDAAHAFGARYKGKMIGNHGDFVCFSFQAIKQLTSIDGGAIVCKNPDMMERIQQLRYFGIDRNKRDVENNTCTYDITEFGYKGNMDEVSAVIGLHNLLEYHRILERYQSTGEFYLENLSNVPGITHIPRLSYADSGFWTFCMKVERKEDFIKALKSKGINVGYTHMRNDHYSLFKDSHNPDLPGVEEFTKNEILLPCCLAKKERYYVVDCIKAGW